VLAAGWLAEEWQTRSVTWRRWTLGATAGFAGFGLALTLAIHQITWAQPVLARIAGPATLEQPTPLRRIDPTARLRGWRTLAREVDAIRDELRQRGIEAEIAGAAWTLPGELGFYCAGHPTVYSLGPVLGDRHSQYDLWHPNPVDDPDSFRGKTFIVVGANEQLVRVAFECVEPMPDVTHFEQGEPINRWSIVVGHGFRGFAPVAGAKRF
jgi:hypothetical protein